MSRRPGLDWGGIASRYSTPRRHSWPQAYHSQSPSLFITHGTHDDREGLNLHPLEFTFVKQGEAHPPGVVLASEFSACSSMLNGALRINPFDIKRVVTALDHAIRLEPGDRRRRRDRDLPYISERPSSLWTRQVLQDLWAAKAETPELLKVEGAGGVRVQYQPVWQTTYKHLDADEVKRAYAQASRRFIFTDFGGTLMEKEKVDLYIKRSFTQTTGKRCVQGAGGRLALLNDTYLVAPIRPHIQTSMYSRNLNHARTHAHRGQAEPVGDGGAPRAERRPAQRGVRHQRPAAPAPGGGLRPHRPHRARRRQRPVPLHARDDGRHARRGRRRARVRCGNGAVCVCSDPWSGMLASSTLTSDPSLPSLTGRSGRGRSARGACWTTA